MPDNVLTPEVIVNELGIGHDCLIAATVINYTATPPGSPADGDCYLVAASATGAWSGKDQTFAFYSSGWQFVTCPQGYTVTNLNDGYRYKKGASTWAAVTVVDKVTGQIATVANQDYTLLLNAPWPGTITHTTMKSDSGTCTATVKVNGSAISGTANSVSSTRSIQSHTQTFAAGDDITMTISSNSSCLGLGYTIEFTRPVS